MTERRQCPRCGTNLSTTEDLRELCPRCLLLLGLGGQEGELRLIGAYEVLREIGRGGMGIVYKAYQPSLNQVFALKVLSEPLARHAAFVERFRNEARVASQLSHPNVVTIYGIEQVEDRHFIVMEYVKGRPLSDWMEEPGGVDLGFALEVTRQVLQALAAAHKLGIIHRDIKPQNILVDPAGHVKVVDFGLAKLSAEAVSILTETGQVLGTPAYMAPERCRGEKIDGRADLYSTGVVLYQLLTRREPFTAETPAAILHQILHEPVPEPRTFNRAIPEPVAAMVLRALAKDVQDRYGSAEEMSRAIEACLAVKAKPGDRSGPPLSRPPAKRPEGRLQRGRQKVARKVGIAVLLAAIIVAVLFVINRIRPVGEGPGGSPGDPSTHRTGKPIKLKASDADVSDALGAVAIQGNSMIAGAFCDDDKGADSGAAYVFERSGTGWAEAAKLTARDGAAGNWFGWAVALDGNAALVGAPGDNGPAKRAGAVYVFERRGSRWRETAKLTAHDGALGNRFGWAVAIDGRTAVVGACADGDRGPGAGAIYVVHRNGSGWTAGPKITASDGVQGDEFGYSLAIAGGTIVVGARGKEEWGNRSAAGAAYVFRDTSAARDWTSYTETRLIGSDTGRGDAFGTWVAICADSIVVGARRDDDGGNDAGSAYVFRRSGNRWVQQAKLTANDSASGDHFGGSVAIAQDMICVGAAFSDGAAVNCGAVYVFRQSDFRWVQAAKLVAPNTADDDRFGYAVALDGGAAVVAAVNDDEHSRDSGAAYLFDLSGLPIPPAEPLPTPPYAETKLVARSAGVLDVFGLSAASSGGTLIVGARIDVDRRPDCGAAFVFERTGSVWLETATLIASDGATGDWFGHAIAIDGDIVAVGAPYTDHRGRNAGSLYVFERAQGAWREAAALEADDGADGDNFGEAVGIDGHTIVTGAVRNDDRGVDCGAAYIFRRTGAGWRQQAKLVASDGAAGNWFGCAVTICGKTVVVGAPRRTVRGPLAGLVYIFDDSSASEDWSTTSETCIQASDAAARDEFGISVAMDGDTLLVGAHGDDDGGPEAGAAYVFQRSGSQWVQRAKLRAHDGHAKDRFGWRVAVCERRALVSTVSDSDAGFESGSAYLFRDTSEQGDWSSFEETKLTASDAAPRDFFGRSVAITADVAVVGAPGRDEAVRDCGAAYVYDLGRDLRPQGEGARSSAAGARPSRPK